MMQDNASFSIRFVDYHVCVCVLLCVRGVTSWALLHIRRDFTVQCLSDCFCRKIL